WCAPGGSRRVVRPLGRQGRPERQQGRDLRRPGPPPHRHRREVPARTIAGGEPAGRAANAGRQDRGDAPRHRHPPRAGSGARPPAEAAAIAARETEDAAREARPVGQEGVTGAGRRQGLVTPTASLYDAIAPIYDEWQGWNGMTPFATVAAVKLAATLRREA